MSVMPDKEIALILYGNGAELGNFKFFADDLATKMIRDKTFAKPDIVIAKTLDRAAVFAAISGIAAGRKIKELHIYSHAIGGGLYIGYHEATAGANRAAAIRAFPIPFPGGAGTPRIGYEDVLAAETGGILTDHLVREPLKGQQGALKAKFAKNASIKLWGCNSAVSGWIYSDDLTGSRTAIVDQDAPADYYYWRALNTKNVPKPSIAQAFADFFGVPVHGASSGSHIEVMHRGKWVKSDEYKKLTGKMAGEPDSLRLNPDVGTYDKVLPGPTP